MQITGWPPSVSYPASAPDAGVRPDRLGHPGLHYWIWVTHDGFESAICRPADQDPYVGGFLDVLAGLADEARSAPHGWDAAEWPHGVDALDVSCRPGGRELDSGLGRALRDGRRVQLPVLLEAMAEDLRARRDRR